TRSGSDRRSASWMVAISSSSLAASTWVPTGPPTRRVVKLDNIVSPTCPAAGVVVMFSAAVFMGSHSTTPAGVFARGVLTLFRHDPRAFFGHGLRALFARGVRALFARGVRALFAR